MKKQFYRFLFIFIFSALGLGLNEWYFASTNPMIEMQDDAEVVATVIEVSDENERKSEASDYWVSLKFGDALRVGDSLRTDKNGGMKIQFIGSDKVIEIEPESILVLQKSEGKINLDLLDGQVEVKKADTSLAKVGKEAQSLGHADNTITIGGESIDSKAVDLKAQAKTNAQGLSIQILNPEKYETLYVNPENPEPFVVSWKKLPPEFQTNLYVGFLPNKLASLKRGNEDRVLLDTLKEGTLYWQVRALGQGSESAMQTEIYKSKIVNRYPPTPVSPVQQATVKIKTSDEKIKLSWVKAAEYKTTQVEIFSDSQKKVAVFNETLELNEVSLKLYPGQYYWRLTGISSDEKKYSSSLYTFNVQMKNSNRLIIQWDESIPQVQEYLGDNAILNLGWGHGDSNEVRGFRLRVIEEGKPLESALPQMVFEKSLSLKVQKPGRYLASIEAFDDESEKIGSSQIKRFEVKPMPLLSRVFLKNNKEKVLRANDEGYLKIEWAVLENAEAYVIALFNEKNEKTLEENIKNETDSGPFKEFSDLMPGQYRLVVYAQDRYGRSGEKESYPIIVPEPAHLMAPKVKKWEVD